MTNNTQTSLNCCLFQGNKTNLDVNTGPIFTANTYCHVFLTLNGSTGKQQWYIYNQSGSLIYTSIEATYDPSNVFSNVTNMSFAHDKFSNNYGNVTIGTAGWFAKVLNSQEMQNQVNANL